MRCFFYLRLLLLSRHLCQRAWITESKRGVKYTMWAPRVPLGLPKWDRSEQPHFQMQTWDPLGSEVGSTWQIEHGYQVGPTYGQAHSGPMWAPQTKRSGPHLGSQSGSHFAAHLGPKWVPCGIPVGAMPKSLDY